MNEGGGSSSNGPFSGLKGYDSEIGKYQAAGRASASSIYPGTAGAIGVVALFVGFVSFCVGVPVVVAGLILLGGGALIGFGYHRERVQARQLQANAEK